MKRPFTAVLLSGTLWLAAAGTVAAQDIDTGPAQFTNPGYGADYIGWGQSFTVPTVERFLNSFSFDLGNVTSDFSFYSYIYEWNGSTKGSLVWSGALNSVGAANDGYFMVNTGGLGLVANGVYLAMLQSDRGRFGYASGTTRVGLKANSYNGGTLVADNGINLVIRDGGNFVDANGNVHGANHDAAFRADFAATGQDRATVTPEPLSMALLGTGLAGVAAARRRRRKREEELA
ncbi:MAG TPA: PEP-CTERM sorting domain-containing protein [Longimicrobium sp.]|jgi:hypothetical protein